MFGRSKQPQKFDITEHPEMIAALNALAEEWYQRGQADLLATARDALAEANSRQWEGDGDREVYLEGMTRVIEMMEES